MGIGFLDRLEHRQQYKLNGERLFQLGGNTVSLFWNWLLRSFLCSRTCPIFAEKSIRHNFPNYGDTIDSRQKDQTHTALIA